MNFNVTTSTDTSVFQQSLHSQQPAQWANSTQRQCYIPHHKLIYCVPTEGPWGWIKSDHLHSFTLDNGLQSPERAETYKMARHHILHLQVISCTKIYFQFCLCANCLAANPTLASHKNDITIDRQSVSSICCRRNQTFCSSLQLWSLASVSQKNKTKTIQLPVQLFKALLLTLRDCMIPIIKHDWWRKSNIYQTQESWRHIQG